jgi:hypothetical protein
MWTGTYLRSCYETDCLFAPGQTTPSRIRWYFVDDDAAQLPFGTIFTPNIWLDVPEGDQLLGEVPGAARTWTDGSAPYPVAGTGPPCGTAAQFQGGQVFPWDPPAVNVFGGLACCTLPGQDLATFCPALGVPLAPAYVATFAPADGGLGTVTLTLPPVLMTQTAPCTFSGPGFVFLNGGGGHTIPATYTLTFRTRTLVQLIVTPVSLAPPAVWENHGGPDPLESFVVGSIVIPPWVGPSSVQITPSPDSPNACANLSGSTSPVYYLTVPFYVPYVQDLPRVRVGTYALFQSAPCTWQGSVTLVNGVFGVGGSDVPCTLTVGPGGVATVTITPQWFPWLFGPLTYTGLAGWDGTGAIGVVAAIPGPLTWLYPPAATVAAPVIP